MEKILVFRPLFPRQTILPTLASKPDLEIQLPSRRTNLEGHIDPDHPHAINHLIVGDIGLEEILLVACDDGDVISYNVRSIEQVIEHSNQPCHPCCPPNPTLSVSHPRDRLSTLHAKGEYPHLLAKHSVEPWFCVNVGASAWGLAIHKEARLIAISSNAQYIDLFVPGLGRSTPHIVKKKSLVQASFEEIIDYFAQSDDQSNRTFWYSAKNRFKNQHLRLRGHDTNIPNVAFFNSDLDKDGRYLASTDIDNKTIIWDLHKHCIAVQFYSGSTLSTNIRFY